jgi:hypothetical protein
MSLLPSIFKGIKKALGLGGDDLAKQQEKQLRQQQEAAKLQAANEVQQVTQFDETVDPSFAGANEDFRRKKKSTGSYASGIGLQI